MQTLDIPGTNLCGADYLSAGGKTIPTLPYCLRVLAENSYRQDSSGDGVASVVARQGDAVRFRPARLLLQDMLGLPLLVDLMALRSIVASSGGDATHIDMSLPVDLVVDHAMTIEHWATPDALQLNQAREFEMNAERFAFIKACAARFTNLNVVPPGGGIMHQVNIEHLAVVARADAADKRLWIPDTCLGTDSHTPMVNGVGVLGWGIGGLEAEAIMLGECATVNVPRVVGVEVVGSLRHDATATDIALALAEQLRAVGVVDCFVELFGRDYAQLSVADRGTIANMAPEYGATSVYCPIDANTLTYLRSTGRNSEHVDHVEAYCRTQQLWAENGASSVHYDQVITLNLNKISRSVAGPSRPEQRVALSAAAETLAQANDHNPTRRFPVTELAHDLGDGDVVVAAITSCTNTANPRNIVLAGLLARNAVARGLRTKPHVKTSLAPGSRVVATYLQRSGLQDALSTLGFEIAAFSCSTCNGMSGPLHRAHEDTIKEHSLDVVAVLSGNRNFPGRIHPLASRNVLAAPPLVVAYALAGTIAVDITRTSLGSDAQGLPIMLDDLWPDEAEVDEILSSSLQAEDFRDNYANIARVNPHWNALDVNNDDYEWQPSTYVSFPPYIKQLATTRTSATDNFKLSGLRPLVVVGDSITTDHISPSGTITQESEAGKFLLSHGISPRDFNSFGTRRGSAEIVIRSTFANLRLRNEMTPDHEGSWTRLPSGEIVSIYAAIDHYRSRNEQLIVIGGREYGCGSSRDTAAKAPWLAGIRAVVVESFERIHRSNLVNMGIAPLCFPQGITRRTLGLVGDETYDVALDADLHGATLTIHKQDGSAKTVNLDLRLYNDAERATFRAGGLLPRAYAEFMTTP